MLGEVQQLGSGLGPRGARPPPRLLPTSAATIEPRFIQARINLAVAYAEQGEAEAAKLELHTALHIAPRHRRVHLNMALLLLSGLLIDEDPETTCKTALIHLRTVVDISPDWAEVSRLPHPAHNGSVTAP